MDLTKIYGDYYLKEEDDSIFTNEFFLTLQPTKDGKSSFFLEMITSGVFGKLGRTWLGTGVFRSDHFAMIIKRELDWVLTGDSDEKTTKENEQFETLPLEIYPYEKEIILYHKKIEKKLHFKRVKKENDDQK